MPLPYPPDVESGQPNPGRPAAVRTFDVAEHVREAIVASSSGVHVFGVAYELQQPEQAEALVERWRQVVTDGLNEKTSAPDAALWTELVEQASAQLRHHPQADDSVLEVLRLTIDNL